MTDSLLGCAAGGYYRLAVGAGGVSIEGQRCEDDQPRANLSNIQLTGGRGNRRVVIIQSCSRIRCRTNIEAGIGSGVFQDVDDIWSGQADDP
jgi:hypothetical protein